MNPHAVTAAQYRERVAKPKRSKYRNKPIMVDGVRFDSRRELNRWVVLLERQRRGEISALERQVTYELAPSVKIASEKRARPALRFKVDFRYLENGQTVVEDAKGFADTAFKIRQHLLKAIHGLDVRLS